jgi:cytochrome c biogenesis factor
MINIFKGMSKFPKRVIVLMVTLILILFVFTLPVMASGLVAPPGGDDVPIVVTVTEDWYVLVFGVLLSLACSYVPGMSTWYAKQTSEYKSLFMLIGIFVIMAVTYTLTCYGLITSNLTCSMNGALNALVVYILTLAVNAGVYTHSPQTAAVKAAKASRV